MGNLSTLSPPSPWKYWHASDRSIMNPTTSTLVFRMLLLGLASTMSGLAYGQSIGLEHGNPKLLPDDGAKNDSFGTKVATDGEHCLVGAPGDDDFGQQSGSAYVFVLSTGRQVLKLTPSDGAPDDMFGNSVGIAGDRAIIGAYHDDDLGILAGSAYVFEILSGKQLFKLTASDGMADDGFGVSVAISEDRVVVGAYQDDAYAGSAYVFDLASGQELFKLNAADTSAGDRFGFSVAVSDGRVIVGAPSADVADDGSGSAYVFDLASGQELHKLIPKDGAYGDAFGVSVALAGDRALVGSYQDDDMGIASGSAYVFSSSTGDQLLKLTANDGETMDTFGVSVAAHGGWGIIGARLEDDLGADAGAAYLFDLSTGQQLLKIRACDGAPGDTFGIAVAMANGTAVIAAPQDDDNGPNSGSAYVYKVPATIGGNYCIASANSSGHSARIRGWGTKVIVCNQLTLETVDVAQNQFGYYLMSDAQAFVPGFGGSQGNLCLGPPIKRFAKDVGFSGPGGVITLQLDLTSLPQGTVFQPGETWNFQLWFRDVNPSFTSNTSDGLAITFQ